MEARDELSYWALARDWHLMPGFPDLVRAKIVMDGIYLVVRFHCP